MKLLNLFIGDIKFQAKYGFYILYLFFTIMYVAFISIMPQSWRQIATIIFVFTDPATLGLFFIGAIVLFEKSQHVLDSINVCPVPKSYYIISKVLSMLLISVIVGMAISLCSRVFSNYFIVLLALILCSPFFTLVALCISTLCKSLNNFMLLVVPAEIVFLVPAVIYEFDVKMPLLRFHPGVCTISIFNYSGDVSTLLIDIATLIVWNIIAYFVTLNLTKKMFSSLGGVKL